MIKLYGISASRAFRPMWLMEEIGLDYELIPVDFRKGENWTKDYLAINPNGKIPTLVDDDLVLYESMAINLYLAKQYGGDFYPDDPAQEALANMWSYWVMTEVEHSLLTILLNTRLLPEEQRKPERIERNLLVLEKPFSVLNDALEGKTFLIGETFCIADLNVAAVISWCRPARVNLKRWPIMKNWLERCISRPAFKQATRK
jgi:glutathione S-transferase